jgi:hypothetical protein
MIGCGYNRRTHNFSLARLLPRFFYFFFFPRLFSQTRDPPQLWLGWPGCPVRCVTADRMAPPSAVSQNPSTKQQNVSCSSHISVRRQFIFSSPLTDNSEMRADVMQALPNNRGPRNNSNNTRRTSKKDTTARAKISIRSAAVNKKYPS